MSNIWNYDALRIVIFALVTISFFILVYRGVYKAVADRKNFYWDRLVNLCWCFAVAVGIAQILYDGLPGGWRLWVTFAVSCLQLFVVLFKSPYIRESK